MVSQRWPSLKLFTIILQLTTIVMLHTKQGPLTTFEGNTSPGPPIFLFVAATMEKRADLECWRPLSCPPQYWKKKVFERTPEAKLKGKKDILLQPQSSNSRSFSDFKFLDDEVFEQQRTLGTGLLFTLQSSHLEYVLVKQHRCLHCH